MYSTGNVTGGTGDVYLAGLMSDPRATTEIKSQLNLDSRETTKTWSFTAGPNLPSVDAYNYSTAITVYDSLGNPHLVYTYFTKTSVNTWDAHVIYNTNNDPTNPNYTEVGSFTLNFDDTGKLTTDPPTTSFTFGFYPMGSTKC